MRRSGTLLLVGSAVIAQIAHALDDEAQAPAPKAYIIEYSSVSLDLIPPFFPLLPISSSFLLNWLKKN
jgi:hypothetical protein